MRGEGEGEGGGGSRVRGREGGEERMIKKRRGDLLLTTNTNLRN